MSKCYIPRDHFTRHVVVISDDTDESLAEEMMFQGINDVSGKF